MRTSAPQWRTLNAALRQVVGRRIAAARRQTGHSLRGEGRGGNKKSRTSKKRTPQFNNSLVRFSQPQWFRQKPYFRLTRAHMHVKWMIGGPWRAPWRASVRAYVLSAQYRSEAAGSTAPTVSRRVVTVLMRGSRLLRGQNR